MRIRDLRDKNERQTFTGREEEINLFIRIIKSDNPQFAILNFFGVGGVGKTSLLHRFQRIANDNDAYSCLIDMDTCITPLEALKSICDQLGEVHFKTFKDTLKKIENIESRIQNTVKTLGDGAMGFVEGAGPLGGLAAGLIGRERVREFLYQHLPKPEAGLYLDANKILTQNLTVGLNELAIERKVVLMFDTFEKATQSIDEWLHNILLEGDVSARVLLVITGREELGEKWESWYPVIYRQEIKPFTRQEALLYLQAQGITDSNLCSAILEFTGQLPWALALITDINQTSVLSLEDVSGSQRYIVQQKVVERFVRQLVSPKLLKVVECCAVLRKYNADLVSYILGENVDESLRELSRFSFVKIRETGKRALHDVVREFIDDELRRTSEDTWRKYNLRASEYYGNLLKLTREHNKEWQTLILEYIFHLLRANSVEALIILHNLYKEIITLNKLDLAEQLLSTMRNSGPLSREQQQWFEYYSAHQAYCRNQFQDAEIRYSRLLKENGLLLNLKAEVLDGLAAVYHYRHMANSPKAEKQLLESVQVKQLLKDEQGLVTSLIALGELTRYQGKKTEAIQYYQEAQELAERQGMKLEQARVLAGLGQLYRLKGDHQQSVDACLQCVEILTGIRETENTVNYKGLGMAHFRLGQAYKDLGQWSKAIDELKKALLATQKAGDRYYEGRVLTKMAEIHLLRGELDKAEKNYDKSQAVFSEIGSSAGSTIAMDVWGDLLCIQHKFDEALKIFEEGLSIKQQTKDDLGVGRSYFHIAECYTKSQEYDNALEYYSRALDIFVALEDKYWEVKSLVGTAKVHFSTREKEITISILERAETQCTVFKYSDQLADIHLIRGHIAIDNYFSTTGNQKEIKIFTKSYCLALQEALIFNCFVLDDACGEIINKLSEFIKEPRDTTDILGIIDHISNFWQNGSINDETFMNIEQNNWLKERQKVDSAQFTLNRLLTVRKHFSHL